MDELKKLIASGILFANLNSSYFAEFFAVVSVDFGTVLGDAFLKPNSKLIF